MGDNGDYYRVSTKQHGKLAVKTREVEIRCNKYGTNKHESFNNSTWLRPLVPKSSLRAITGPKRI